LKVILPYNSSQFRTQSRQCRICKRQSGDGTRFFSE